MLKRKAGEEGLEPEAPSLLTVSRESCDRERGSLCALWELTAYLRRLIILHSLKFTLN